MNLPRKRLFWSVAFGHATNDLFMSTGPVVLAFLSVLLLPMSNTAIGFAVGLRDLLGAASQPFFGLLSDRYGGRWIGTVGVAWSVIFTLLAVAVAALTGQYGLMLIPYALSALGSGAFHPAGTTYAAESDQAREASNMAYFFLFGQLGLALGPALAGFLLDQANPANGPQEDVTPLFFLGLTALPAVVLMLTSIPLHRREEASTQDAPSSGKSLSNFLAALPVKPLLVLGLLVALRSLAQPGSVTFIPRLFQSKGWDPSEFGLITSSFWVASGLSGVIFGNLADRYDRRHIIAVGLFLSAPALFLLPLAEARPLAFGLAFLTGALTGGSHSVIVVLAQSLIPSQKGFASGAILGFTFGMGALGSLILGGLSDAIGLETAFQVVAGSAALASMLALALPAGTARRRVAGSYVEDEAEPVPTLAK